MKRSRTVCVYSGEALGRYGFGDDHPFGEDRMHAFWDEMHRAELDYQVRHFDPVKVDEALLTLFHTPAYVNKVKTYSEVGEGLLDYGDTPAYKGVFDDASYVVGSTVDAMHKLMRDEVRRAFIPIAGLHHSMPDTAAGFCVFNDVGVAIKLLQQEYGLERIAYVDIDAHHGDGLFYPFEDDPKVIFADIHEDGRYNFPQTGFPEEIGKGAAEGKKLNLPLLPLAADKEFLAAWKQIEDFLDAHQPQFIIMNCGADGLDGDPLAHLHYTTRPHAHATASLCRLAEKYAEGRLLAVGGGGYDLRNIGKAWTAVVKSLIETPM